jgi:class 3 adenylate cyclase
MASDLPTGVVTLLFTDVEGSTRLLHELDNLRVAAEWAVATWAEDEARGVLAGLNEFFFAHSWFDGAETFERLAGVASDASGLTSFPSARIEG